MSLNGKQRSELRRLGNTMDSVFQLGKDGISEETYRHLDNLLRTRELIKITVLKSCLSTRRKLPTVWLPTAARLWCR